MEAVEELHDGGGIFRADSGGHKQPVQLGNGAGKRQRQSFAGRKRLYRPAIAAPMMPFPTTETVRF